MPALSKDLPRPARSEGEQPRDRLLLAALRLFAQNGYSKTSTREIAEAAQVNIAAISYYFGDKAGLYRAVFTHPLGSPADALAPLEDPALSLPEALHGFFAIWLEPFRHGDMVQQCMKLHVREMLEPTGVWGDELVGDMKPRHLALVALLCRHLGLRRADDELHRLAVCISGLGVHLHVGRDVMNALAPRLNAHPKATDPWAERLVMYAEAMVGAEARRRGITLKENE